MRPRVIYLTDEVYDMLKSMSKDTSELVSLLIEREYTNRLQEKASQIKLKKAIRAIHEVAERAQR